MKKSFILLGLLMGIVTQAQTEKEYYGKVGFNTQKPKATMDINPNPANSQETATTNEGILIPRLSKTRVANMVSPEESTMVYVNNVTYGGNNPKVAGITEKGFYYYDGTVWVRSQGTSVAAKDGVSMYSGEGNPVATLGNIDDTYLDRITGDLWMHIASTSGRGKGVWTKTGQKIMGPQGPAGAKGEIGLQGIAGAKGDKGETGPAGPRGLQGVTGAKGSSMLSGATDPATNVGASGDTYVNTATGSVWTKSGTAWTNTGQTLRGPQGQAGARGATGPAGARGLQGVAGAKGDKGETGAIGPAGARGLQGAKGDKGDAGVVTGLRGITYNATDRSVALPTGTSNNQVLKWNGTAWTPSADANTTYASSTTNTVSGNQIHRAALTGDVTAAQNNNATKVVRIQGRAVESTTPAVNQTLVWTGSAWAPQGGVRTVTAATTLSVRDNGGYIYVNSSVALTITVPSGLPSGFSCVIIQKGTGQVTIAGSGVTLQTARGTKTRKQHSAIGVIKDAATTVTITGDAV